MEEKDSWSILLEYLKLAIGLSTAIIAAAAAFYVDNSKIPTGQLTVCGFAIPARYLLLVGVAAFGLVLACALFTMGFLSNHFVKFPTAARSSAAAGAKSATASAAAARAAASAIQAREAEVAARTANPA